MQEKQTYAVRTEVVGGATRYYAAFRDGAGNWQETEIPREVYLALEECRLAEKRQKNAFERHIEHADLSEEQLALRLAAPDMPLEERAALTVDMNAALDTLTPTQRRRFLLYHEMGLSYAQIAKAESLSKQAIAQSIGKAEAALKKYFSEGG